MLATGQGFATSAADQHPQTKKDCKVAGMSRVAVIALDRRMNPLAFHTAAGLGFQQSMGIIL